MLHRLVSLARCTHQQHVHKHMSHVYTGVLWPSLCVRSALSLSLSLSSPLLHTVRHLLEKGVGPNISNADGLTPLHKVHIAFPCLSLSVVCYTTRESPYPVSQLAL